MEDIIVALATAWGESGIAIVRMSGEGCTALADRLFRSKKTLAEYPSRYLVLGKLVTTDEIPFDEILAVRFENKKSYTGEESVELQCHGGTVAAQKCIEELCALGARIALPGEFTRRAFTNGRIDLAQAESVLGIIKAQSDEALIAANRTLQGNFSKDILDFLEKLTNLAALLEVDLDFPEEDTGVITKAESISILNNLIESAHELEEKCRSGLVLREGIKAAIIGKPNVGKSSLLNALLREQRAIVTAVPGTTRDSIEETVIYRGIPIRFVDTAGIRATEDEVESIGVGRSIKLIKDADMCIWMLDSSEPFSDEDRELWRLIGEKPHVVALNKSDLVPYNNEKLLREITFNSNVISISALNSQGIENLKELIVKDFVNGNALAGSYGVTSRQMRGISAAISALVAARDTLIAKIGDDVALACIADARVALAEVIGADSTEDLVNRIFKDFCVGK